MANLVKYIYGTEAQILALTPDSPSWIEQAFYYPTDKTYFYQAYQGEMKKYGAGDGSAGTLEGVGVTLNGKVIGGVKSFIEASDELDIPENYEYNSFFLSVEGIVNCNGIINTI